MRYLRLGLGQVLLDMNISVPELREVTQNVGSLGDVSTWSRTILAFSLLWWITNPNQLFLGRVLEVYAEEQSLPQVLRYVMFALAALESVVFLTLLLRGTRSAPRNMSPVAMPQKRIAWRCKEDLLVAPEVHSDAT